MNQGFEAELPWELPGPDSKFRSTATTCIIVQKNFAKQMNYSYSQEKHLLLGRRISVKDVKLEMEQYSSDTSSSTRNLGLGMGRRTRLHIWNVQSNNDESAPLKTYHQHNNEKNSL